MEARIDKLVKENLKITKKYDETFDVLMKQQNQVVKPLKTEIVKLQTEVTELRS